VADTCQRLASLTGDPEASATASAPASAPTESAGASAPSNELDVSFLLDDGPADADATIANLVAEIAEHWTCSIVTRPAEADGRWHLSVAANADRENLRSMLEFLVRSDSIRIDSAEAAATTDEAYGFFDAEPTPIAASGTEAYGFFDAEPSPAAAPADEGWGLFDTPAKAEAPAASPSPASADDSFGFFVDLPTPAPEIAVSPAPTSEPVLASAPPVVERRDSARSDRRATPRAAAGGETSIRVDMDKVDS
jgi:hypothetical protein